MPANVSFSTFPTIPYTILQICWYLAEFTIADIQTFFYLIPQIEPVIP